MSKFFMQHIGEALSKRDFPKSLGTPATLRVFSYNQLSEWPEFMEAISPLDNDRLGRDQTGWQIWGLPAGAARFTRQMHHGDTLMLLGSERTCEFIATVDYKVPAPSPIMSKRIWGEAKFPQIVLLKNSAFIDLLWADFLRKVGYKPDYGLRGATSRVSDSKLKAAGLQGVADLESWVRKFAVAK